MAQGERAPDGFLAVRPASRDATYWTARSSCRAPFRPRREGPHSVVLLSFQRTAAISWPPFGLARPCRAGPRRSSLASARLPLLSRARMAARGHASSPRRPYLGRLWSLRGPYMARFARNRSGYPYPLLQFSAGRRRTMRGSLGSWSPGNGRSSRRLWPMAPDELLESWPSDTWPSLSRNSSGPSTSA